LLQILELLHRDRLAPVLQRVDSLAVQLFGRDVGRVLLVGRVLGVGALERPQRGQRLAPAEQQQRRQWQGEAAGGRGRGFGSGSVPGTERGARGGHELA
jgi:hypothetical protein